MVKIDYGSLTKSSKQKKRYYLRPLVISNFRNLVCFYFRSFDSWGCSVSYFIMECHSFIAGAVNELKFSDTEKKE